MSNGVKFLTKLSLSDEGFLRDHTNMLVCDKNDEGIYGVANFIYTYSLVNRVGMSIGEYTHFDRYCYPKNKFSLNDMIEMLKGWDGKSEPPAGWIKYKGMKGEYTPDDRDNN